MQLTLRPTSAAQRPACAAFLRGTDAGAWLREIGRWGLPAEQLSCYLVPESIRSVRPAGLLVVAPDGAPLPADVLEPYGVEAGRLYVPTHATIWPATAPEELRAALLWPRQLWHPALGLVGFEEADALDLTALLSYPPPRPTDWGRALPGRPLRPALQRLQVEAPSAEQVMQTMQQQVATESLSALPPRADEPGPGLPLLAGLRRGLLRAGLAVVSWLQRPGRGPRPGAGPSLWRPLLNFALAVGGVILGMGLLIWLVSAFADGGSGAGSVAALLLIALLIRLLMLMADARQARSDAPAPAPQYGGGGNGGGSGAGTGVLGRLGRWLGASLEGLEKKRNAEIERLLRLFGDNVDEALRYAIPLGGAYQNRGTAPASDTLGPRNTTFSLSGLGGGRRVDGWDVDAYEQDLRRQYLAAAEREVQAGRYQKAAYIHAHLLADYHRAAQVLEQGGFFREAAALYKDHLHNRPAAAQCLERGGLLLEAAELFAELKQHERAGDLYQRLDQPRLAARHYERSVEHLLAADDHAEAGRLLQHKLRDADRARAVLLQGWAADRQPETCLRRYFTDLIATTPEADPSAHVRRIYQQHTPAPRRVPLLQVLAHINEQHPDAALLATSRELAYEVVGAEAAAGRTTHLGLLKTFLPDDRLIGADVSRYTTARQRRPSEASPTASLQAPQLDASISWRHAVGHRQQWVAVGLRDGRLHLARGNWYGHVEYYSWTTPVPDNELVPLLLSDELHSSRILLRVSVPGLAFDAKLLPQNKYFPQSLRVECPAWLPAWPTRVALLPDDELATLHFHDGLLQLQPYSAEGQLRPARTYELPNADARAHAAERPGWPCEMLYRQGSFFTYADQWLLRLLPDGSCHAQELQGSVLHLVASPFAATLRLGAVAEEGLVVWTPDAAGSEVEEYCPEEFPNISDLQFVGPQHVVAFQLNTKEYDLPSYLYQFTPEPDGPTLLRTIEEEAVAVLPTLDRQRFAVLTMQGQVTLHTLAGA
ncbi:hypothetical protein EJV47_14465 [Hymenobacter gummosus]|uniref:MoxR-vWA-beta-propeller ternary system domain-containing protein n=1 Tax=Hymenobacter gummosus TaxID=1776032 RepID=A0A3S0H438_9BACT|nr:hypothetical protein [Hymenobacter gummosus]RTQ48806.1 hypothetical protein EJV47_14465 [Hymenobacter gummosus]